VTEGTVKMTPTLPILPPSTDKGSSPVGGDANGQGVLLPAGSVASSESGAVLVKKADVTQIERHLTWRSGTLTFRDTPLADAVAEFNRYNRRQIVIEDPAIAAIEVGGVFRATNLEPFIHLMEEGFPVTVTEEGDRIVLRARPHTQIGLQ
jgi:transmembrane sensor